jgi:ketosteroid isomerase-like protein
LSLQHRLAIATISLALIFSTNVSTARAQQSSPPSNKAQTDKAQIIDTVSTIFTAARADDVAKFDSVIAPGFYIYDGGARFNGDSIMAFIKAQHAAGKHYEWNVTEPDVHINGNTAWIAYVNQGSITDASGTQNLKWLESAFLQKQAGAWKIVFLHSTRVPPAPQEKATAK